MYLHDKMKFIGQSIQSLEFIQDTQTWYFAAVALTLIWWRYNDEPDQDILLMYLHIKQ